jgi:hypothetical protein
VHIHVWPSQNFQPRIVLCGRVHGEMQWIIM